MLIRTLSRPGSGRWWLSLVTAALSCALSAHAADAPPAVDFNRQIRPILSDRCFACHGPDANHRKAGLRLDDETSAKAESIVPGKPEESPLIARITTTDPDEVMPPAEAHKPALTEAEVAIFRQWIAEGAVWAQHWAYEKPKPVEPPAVQNTALAATPIDQFLLARLEAESISPTPEASKETLLRRLSLDLTGLPPTPQETDAFLADPSSNAYEKQVDRLLASPHYGERMAMDWLDGARFADTNGYQNDFNRSMWLWRDWVIRAFNDNMPYDQFTVEQIAGDLLPNATTDQQLATGFCRNNRSTTEGGSIEEEWHVEKVIDRVETTSTVFLGITMGCARCHDHKYDPISQTEFYQFYAFFNGSEDRGFYEETRGNTGPIVRRPSFEQQLELDKLEVAVKDARTALEKAQGDTSAGFETWKTAIAAADAPAVGRTQSLHVPLQGDLGYVTRELEGLATFGGPAPVWAEGLLGDALQLDGTPESFVDLGQSVRFERDQKFSIATWIKVDGPGSPFSKMDDAAAFRGVDLMVGAEGELAVHLVNSWPDNALKVIAEPRLPLGKWAHVCVTYDGSSNADGIRIYIAGRRVEHRTETATLTGSIDTEQPLRLGRRSESSHFKGMLSDFRVFNRVLTDRKVNGLVEGTVAQAFKAPETETRTAALHDFFALRGDDQVTQAREKLTQAEQTRDKYLNEQVPSAMVMKEMAEPRPTYKLVRGQYNAPDTSELLQPAVPKFLPPLPADVPHNRLALARWLVSPENPLTARVAVNRLWNKFFGQGLVKTLDNFGVQSEAPLHPGLLDWLATDFMATGWDVKGLQKKLVMSSAYRRSSTVTPELLARDPDNRLLARGPRFRLNAEVIRDNALAIGGLLRPRIGGPSVKPYQPDGLWAELAGGAGEGPYVQDTGDDLYRRSLYTYRKRTVPHPTLTTFDAPSFELCTVYRARTNTPLQALALLNDTTYVEAARGLAQRMLTETQGEHEQRLVYGFRLATGRVPSASETTTLNAGLTQYLATYAGAPEEANTLIANGDSEPPAGLDPVQLAAYTAVAGVLLNLDETITKE